MIVYLTCGPSWLHLKEAVFLSLIFSCLVSGVLFLLEQQGHKDFKASTKARRDADSFYSIVGFSSFAMQL